MKNKINPFLGKSIAITGKLKGFTREGVNCLLIKLGAVPSRNVTARTDYLICGSKPGSKLAKAKILGIPVLTERQFYDMIPKKLI